MSVLSENFWTVSAPDRDHLDISDRSSVLEGLLEFMPTTVINTAAYTDVDGAEDDIRALQLVNVQGVQNLVESCSSLGIRLVHVSTASVFGSSGIREFSSLDDLCPVNAYNRSKADAEQVCMSAWRSGVDVSWVRTYWLYGGFHANFVDFVVNQILANQPINVVRDQWGQPTYARDLAILLLKLLNVRDVRGPIHGVNSGATSRLEWARAITTLIGGNQALIRPVSASEFSARAARPTACILETPLPGDAFAMRPWHDALHSYLISAGHARR